MAAMTSATIMQVAAFSSATSSKAVSVGFNATQRCPLFLSARRSAAPYRKLSISCEAEATTAGAKATPEVLDKVREVIAKQLAQSLENITPDAKFSDIGADSLDTVEIMMALEETFDITLGEDNADKITTVQDAADLIHSFVEAKK